MSGGTGRGWVMGLLWRLPQGTIPPSIFRTSYIEYTPGGYVGKCCFRQCISPRRDSIPGTPPFRDRFLRGGIYLFDQAPMVCRNRSSDAPNSGRSSRILISVLVSDEDPGRICWRWSGFSFQVRAEQGKDRYIFSPESCPLRFWCRRSGDSLRVRQILQIAEHLAHGAPQMFLRSCLPWSAGFGRPAQPVSRASMPPCAGHEPGVLDEKLCFTGST